MVRGLAIEDSDNGWAASADAERLRASGARDMVDIGCGEGRFRRMARDAGRAPIGIDPTEALTLPDASVDRAVFCLTLIDIPDLSAALTEAVRVLRPGGRILIANLARFITIARPQPVCARCWRQA